MWKYFKFLDSDNAIYSTTEFIYSCRDSPESPYPELNSPTTAKALELIKKIKNELSSEEIFVSKGNFSMLKLMDYKTLFVKFYFMPNVINEGSPFVMKPMPGIKEGISGTILVGYNIGIVGNIEEKKLSQPLKP